MFEDILECGTTETIGGKPAFDFLPNIQKNSREDLNVLKFWKLYFDSLRIPYRIEDCGDRYKMWKEQYVDDGGETI